VTGCSQGVTKKSRARQYGGGGDGKDIRKRRARKNRMTTETAKRWRPSEKKAGDRESMLCDDHPDAVC